MGISVNITDANGDTVERMVSHLDLIKAHYGIGDAMPLRSVILIATSAVILGLLLGVSMFIEQEGGRFGIYLAAFGLIAHAAGSNAGTRHQNEVLEQIMTRAPYVPTLAFVALSYATGALAAFSAIEIGGITGFSAGLAIAIVFQINRLSPRMLFALRIWNAKRFERQTTEASEAGKKEGWGGD
jgi:hypothetical protein